jgi:hypothetical protein
VTLPYSDTDILIDFSAPVSVSVLTALLPFTSWPHTGGLLFAVVNLDAANPLTVILDRSEDGVSPDSDPVTGKTQTATAPPLSQCSFEIGPNPLASYWRLSAHTASPGFPTVQVKWRVKAIVRRQ